MHLLPCHSPVVVGSNRTGHSHKGIGQMAKKIENGHYEIIGRFVFLGITDEVTACDCCGRSNLKSTVAFDVAGEIVHYGSTCAARHTGRKVTVWVSEKKAKEEDIRKQVRTAINNSPETKAYMARQNEGHALKVPPGKTFRDFMAPASEALHALEVRLYAEAGVSKY